jgi:hypothetical protein
LNGYITKEGLNILVEYAYTAQLEVPDEMVKRQPEFGSQDPKG